MKLLHSIVCVCVVVVLILFPHATKESRVSKKLPVAQNRALPAKELLRLKIWREAELAGVDPNAAVRIARCESGLNPLARSKTSSAKGLYQFIDGTWDYINAPGSPLDEDEAIRQFLKYYPTNKHWWECK